MRKIMPICIAALLATVVAGTWVMTRTAQSHSATLGDPPMNPFEMMMNVDNLPVHNIVDAV
jgi:predicted Co/Zn/Cd cation transporter (cation efflux family)